MKSEVLKPLVVLPTYNELENLPSLSSLILETVPTADILVVDDGSPDGTGNWVENAGNPKLNLLQREQKLGLGSAYRAAWTWGIERGYDPIISMDADWSHHPRYLPALLALIEDGADLAIGSRYVEGGGISNWPQSRRLLSSFANQLTRLLLRWKVCDATAGFRAYRAQAIRQIGPDSIRAEGYSFLEESLWRIHKHGLDIQETPIIFEDRRGGQSKINRSEILKAAVNLLLLRMRPSRKTK